MDQFAQTLSAPPVPVPGAAAPTTALPAMTPAFQNYFNSMSGFTDHAVGANKALAQSSVAGVNAANGANDRLKAISTRLDEIQKLQDPKNYTFKPSPDGGLNFFDPLGKPITIGQYVKVTGDDPASILKNSNSSQDLQYVHDYNQLQDLVNSSLQGKTAYEKQLQTLEEQYPGIKDSLKGIPTQQLIQAFQGHYPNVYGTTQSSVSPHPTNQAPFN